MYFLLNIQNNLRAYERLFFMILLDKIMSDVFQKLSKLFTLNISLPDNIEMMFRMTDRNKTQGPRRNFMPYSIAQERSLFVSTMLK